MRQHLRLAVVGELVDDVLVVVDDPDVLLRIVGADGDEVRPLQHRVPLRPRVDQVALGVEDEDAVLPARVHAHLVAARFPRLDAVLGELPGAAVAGQAGGRRVAPRQAADRELDARPESGSRRACGRWMFGSSPRCSTKTRSGLSANTLCPAPNVQPCVAGQRRQVLRPVGDDVIGAEDVLAALLAGHRGHPGHRRRRAAEHRPIACRADTQLPSPQGPSPASACGACASPSRASARARA